MLALMIYEGQAETHQALFQFTEVFMLTIPITSLLIMALMPLVGAAAAKWGFESYDNHNPRAWLAQQTGFRARANAAQANTFEAFPFFAVGVLLAIWTHVDPVWLDRICMAFVVFRGLYMWAYLTDRASLRSTVWALAYLCCISLFVTSMGVSLPL